MGRVNWTDDLSKILLTMLTDEKDKGVSKFNWSNITKSFNARSQLDVQGKQVQNHHGDLRSQFKCWEELQGLSGLSFNHRTNKVDVEEKHLDRWRAFLQKHKRYGLAMAKKNLPNQELLIKLFDGTTAHGVGGCFSPGMALGNSYLSNDIEDFTLDEDDDTLEGSGDNENINEGGGDTIILPVAEESRSPPRSVVRKTYKTKKRKSQNSVDSDELKRRNASFDSVINMLNGAGFSQNAPPIVLTKAQMVHESLKKMGVVEENGDI
ncbi:hypothetical protein SOVF_081080 [Spinacia oleracea]|nr:hypothetical protein SOVF_081080 [Spinacia oleracea]